jgi:hypothetical protein
MDTSILNTLPNLTAEELREVRDRASVLLTIGPKKSSVKPVHNIAQDDFAYDLYTALSDLLYRRTQIRRAPYKVFARTIQYRDHFLSGATAASDVNQQWFPKQTRAERMSMIQLYVKLVINYLDERGRPAVWGNLASAFSSLPEIVDLYFPGYAASGLLGKVQAMRTRLK